MDVMNQNNGWLYKILLNDKIYIGSTRNPKERKKCHLRRCISNNYKHIKLYKNWTKTSKFEFIILDYFENISDYELTKKESERIIYYDSIKNGLNSKNSFLSEEEDLKQRREAGKRYREKHNKKVCQVLKKNRLEHKKNSSFRCDLCNFNFGCKRDLDRHLNTKRHQNKFSL